VFAFQIDHVFGFVAQVRAARSSIALGLLPPSPVGGLGCLLMMRLSGSDSDTHSSFLTFFLPCFFRCLSKRLRSSSS